MHGNSQFQAGSPPHQQALLHHLVHTERATTMQARRFASVSTLAGATRGQSAILPTGAGFQAVVESTPPRPGHARTSGPVISSEFTPLYDQLSHTTLCPVSSHHSTTSKLTLLYDQRAHITLQPASSHHSTTSELTPLYDQQAHITLRPVSSHHSRTNELISL